MTNIVLPAALICINLDRPIERFTVFQSSMTKFEIKSKRSRRVKQISRSILCCQRLPPYGILEVINDKHLFDFHGSVP